ncbi:hypothetical protein [Cellulomonas triticagri]|uniref:hypothetical protein n=1 Tax=Cellulomonas triticagri TaxID=2483352 RepID=UPI0011C3AB94|nr:hypothetical protein [Cellulomonas triticagri]
MDPHGQDVPPEFRRAAKLLRKVALATLDLTDAARPARPGSVAEHETADESFDGAWGRATFQLEHEVPPRLMATADHMTALAALTLEPRVILAMASVVRPCLENLAIVFWLYEPGIDTRERVRRRMNLRLSALVEQQNISAATGNGKDAGVARSLLAIRSSAQQHGYTWKVRRGRPLPNAMLHDRFLDEQMPTQRRLLSELFADSDGTDQGLGKLLQHLTSSVLHGHLHGTAAFILDTEPSSIAEVATAGIGLDASRFAQLYGAVLVGAVSTMARCGQHFGWELGPWMATAHQTMSTLTPWIETRPQRSRRPAARPSGGSSFFAPAHPTRPLDRGEYDRS